MGGDRVLEACRMVVGTVTDAYETSQGAKKKGEVPAPTWGLVPPHGRIMLGITCLCVGLVG